MERDEAEATEDRDVLQEIDQLPLQFGTVVRPEIVRRQRRGNEKECKS